MLGQRVICPGEPVNKRIVDCWIFIQTGGGMQWNNPSSLQKYCLCLLWMVPYRNGSDFFKVCPFLVMFVQFIAEMGIRRKAPCSHSWLGHYFYSNHQGSAPRGTRGVKSAETSKIVKTEKNRQKCLFSDSFSNFLQFRLNICAPNLHEFVQWMMALLLTPLDFLAGGTFIQKISSFQYLFLNYSEWWRPPQLFSNN